MRGIVKAVSAISFLAAILCLYPISAYSMSAFPEINLRYPVLVVLDNGTAASGFYLRDKYGNVYLVSARHVFLGENRKDGKYALKTRGATLFSYPSQLDVNEPIVLKLDLAYLYDHKNFRVHSSGDIAAIKVIEAGNTDRGNVANGVKIQSYPAAGLVTVPLNYVKRYNQVLISNDVFLLGYPTSLGCQCHPQIEQSKPLLRKGIVAGKNDCNKTIIIDCPMYLGNSGGPVIEVEQVDATTKNFYVIGVATQFIPFQERKYAASGGTETGVENSGYSVVIPMDVVLDLLDW
ncbi:MAG: trypsin-like peptidase domain-containing protein [Candidatus Omnitrophica bacterium]|nr:trypsin-like peptidase domain-containing protein [Candidatus Omnitrophota bacterium]